MRESNQGSSQFNFDVGNRKVYCYFTFVKKMCIVAVAHPQDFSHLHVLAFGRCGSLVLVTTFFQTDRH